MATTLRVDLPGYYRRTAIEDLIVSNPKMTPLDATKAFVDRKYGGWIESKMPNADFDIYEIDEDGFEVEFVDDTYAARFVREVGGRKIERTTDDPQI
ncbi:hypothetical protein [Rhizobium skierniewicense]|uniref:hypothetical protein n=1 Tax=Rhizobium skierniewicense TaxID=984260 RepID=UPI0015728A20|nr:hypothetical protein [Rhizobium skierniewicense]NTF34262.1 hypothetical protein [Rhizobium skierniewicense]